MNTCAGTSKRGRWHPSDDGPDGLCAECRAIVADLDKTLPTTWHLYALRRGGNLDHFYGSTAAFSVCGEGDPVIVRLMSDPDGCYWGWLYNHHPNSGTRAGHVSMIFRSEMQLNICFPAGFAEEVRRGRGRVVRMRAEIVRDAVRGEGPDELANLNARPPPVAPCRSSHEPHP